MRPLTVSSEPPMREPLPSSTPPLTVPTSPSISTCSPSGDGTVDGIGRRRHRPVLEADRAVDRLDLAHPGALADDDAAVDGGDVAGLLAGFDLDAAVDLADVARGGERHRGDGPGERQCISNHRCPRKAVRRVQDAAWMLRPLAKVAGLREPGRRCGTLAGLTHLYARWEPEKDENPCRRRLRRWQAAGRRNRRARRAEGRRGAGRDQGDRHLPHRRVHALGRRSRGACSR